MENKKINKNVFLSVVLSLLFVSTNVYCIRVGGSLLSKARQYTDPFCSYSSGQPPNLYYDGQLKNSLYHYGSIWGSATWDGVTDWTGDFDCSGFVSWCADLRRHFGTSEFTSFFSSEKAWETASEGDIIYWSGHVCIFIDYYYSSERSRWEISVIHAADPPIQGGDSGVYEEYGSETYFNNHSAKPYSFKSDSTGPQNSATGVEEGKAYQSTTINYSVSDPDETDSNVYINGNYQKNKIFNVQGNYTLQLKSQDWAKNETDTNIHFTIDTTPPAWVV